MLTFIPSATTQQEKTKLKHLPGLSENMESVSGGGHGHGDGDALQL